MREREEHKHVEVGWITVLLSANVACLVVPARAQEAELQVAWAGVGRRWYPWIVNNPRCKLVTPLQGSSIKNAKYKRGAG